MQADAVFSLRLPSVGAQVAKIIEERILQNVYPIGSKLPPERTLAQEFAVSRPSLRAALRILATRGMIFSRHGDGHYVSEQVEDNFQYGWEGLIGSQGMADEVLDFRRGIEGMLAALAAERRTEADLLRMRSWLDKLKVAYEADDVDAQSTADVAFHQAVAESAHNVLFTRLSDSLLRVLTGQTKQNLGNMFAENMFAELMVQHEAIFAAIERRDAAAAMSAAYGHLDYVKVCLTNFAERRERERVSQALAVADRKR
ncbi:MAG: FadR/GntR family transcriptional regulator [Neisseria sp.]|nr:FadR/GntR family transcriptional regulator [Neisseria sp.]